MDFGCKDKNIDLNQGVGIVIFGEQIVKNLNFLVYF